MLHAVKTCQCIATILRWTLAVNWKFGERLFTTIIYRWLLLDTLRLAALLARLHKLFLLE